VSLAALADDTCAALERIHAHAVVHLWTEARRMHLVNQPRYWQRAMEASQAMEFIEQIEGRFDVAEDWKLLHKIAEQHFLDAIAKKRAENLYVTAGAMH
jgi:hypothetical protein